LLASQLRETRRIVAENRPVIEALAAELKVRKSMTGPEVSDFLKSIDCAVVTATELAATDRDDERAWLLPVERANR
jgi:hypothetical protein